MSTVSLLGALAVYPQSAQAQQVCSGPNSDIECDGSSVDPQLLTNRDDATVSTGANFSVDTATGTAITILGDGAISYTDDNASELRATAYLSRGISIASLGDSGNAGTVTVNTNGAIYATRSGIVASNYGSGATSVTVNGNVTTTAAILNADAISVSNGGPYLGAGGTDLTLVTGAGTVISGGRGGIRTQNQGTGATTITINGDVESRDNGDAVTTINGTTASDMTVTTAAGTTLTGVNRGLGVDNFGSGNTTIEIGGDVTGGTSGMRIVGYGTGVSVTTAQGTEVNAYNIGINARNRGTGDLTVSIGGDVTATRSAGIEAHNEGSAGENVIVETAAGSTVSGGGSGIVAENDGSGNTRVIANGDVTGATRQGIDATATGTQIDIEVGDGATVASMSGDPGTFAVRTSGGQTTLTVRGTLDAGGDGAARFDPSASFDDRLEVRTSAVIHGDILAGPGTDTAGFAGGGTSAFNLSQLKDFELGEIRSGTWAFSGVTDAFFTQTGGFHRGNGTFGGLDVRRGTLSPGISSIDVITVNGPFSMAAASTFEVDLNEAGDADRIVVNGTVNLTKAALRVLAQNGKFNTTKEYLIIENDGTDAVQGNFGKVTDNLPFLTPVVKYDAGTGNDVVLTLERTRTGPNDPNDPNDPYVDFCSVAKTKNQCNVGTAIDKFPVDNQLFLTVLSQTAPGARQAFDALSGEIHATLAGLLMNDNRYPREAVLGRMMQASHYGDSLGAGGPDVASWNNAPLFDGKSLVEVPQQQPLAFWTQGFGAWGTYDGDGNAATANRDLGGFMSGMDAELGEAFGGSWRAGIATGASFSNVSVDERLSSVNTKTYYLGGYLGGEVGGVAVRGGGLWGWSEIETSRAVLFPYFYERQNADYDAETGQIFGEIAYPTQMGGVELEPFAGLAYVSLESGSFREKGGPQASLRTSGIDQDIGYTTLGLRAAKTIMWSEMSVTPHIEAAWLHAFDGVTPSANLAFATTGIGFEVDGVPLAEDSALLDAGVDFALTERLSAGISYTGQYADSLSDNAVRGRLTWLFN